MKPLSPRRGPPVLVVVPDAATRETVLAILAPLACAILAENTAEAEVMLRHESYGALIIEDELPAEPGLMFLARINAQHPWLRRILICRRPEPDLLLFLINEANVFRCVTKPVDPAQLRTMVTSALADHERARALAESAEAEPADRRPHRFGRRTAALRDWVASLPRFLALATLGIGWIFGLGLAALISLYLLKTLLGIDLLEGLHLIDLFR